MKRSRSMAFFSLEKTWHVFAQCKAQKVWKMRFSAASEAVLSGLHCIKYLWAQTCENITLKPSDFSSLSQVRNIKKLPSRTCKKFFVNNTYFYYMHLIIASEITECELNIDQTNKSQKVIFWANILLLII